MLLLDDYKTIIDLNYRPWTAEQLTEEEKKEGKEERL